MTRLKESDLDPIAGTLHEYDADLKRMVGASLRQIARKAAGVDDALMETLLGRLSFAAVPVSSGLGVIHGFSLTVSAIVSHMGFDAFVTERSDVAGVVEGVERGADVLMFADDDRFLAMVPGLRQVVENSQATARGYVAALELMKGGLEGESVLVLGCGSVGVSAAVALLECGASVALCDIAEDRAMVALGKLGRTAPGRVRLEDAARPALPRYELIFDATNSGPFIDSDQLTPRTIVAAPGLPCALTPEAMAGNRDRVLHDALEIGTATMAVQAAAELAKGKGAEKAIGE